MRDAGAIRHKFKQAAFRHLKKRLATRLALVPGNCAYQVVREYPGGPRPMAGMCRCSEFADPDWPGVCDNDLTPDQAMHCPHFRVKADKESIKLGFKAFLATASLAEVAAEGPDLAALMWVMQDEAPNREVEIAEGEDWEGSEEHLVTHGTFSFRVVSAADAERARSQAAFATLTIETAQAQHKNDAELLRVARESGAAAMERAEAAEQQIEDHRTAAEALQKEADKAQQMVSYRVTENDLLKSRIARLKLSIKTSRSWWQRWRDRPEAEPEPEPPFEHMP